MAVTFDEGGLVAWGKGDWGLTRPFGEGMPSPVACFTAQGHLVAVSPGGEARLYDTDEGQVTLRAEFKVEMTDAIGVVPMGRTGFAVVGRAGKICVYE